MHVEYHKWHSPALGHEMELKVYGHWGTPYVVFPCSKGQFFDYESFGMVSAVQGFIDGGHIKLYTVGSVDDQTWYDHSILPGDRNARYEAYDRYIVEELVPFIRTHCQDPNIRPMTNGVSMGAYHAVNMYLKHPDLFQGTLALSGLYNLDHSEFGLPSYDIPHVYFNSPLHYLPDLSDAWFIDWYKRGKIVVCTGQGAWEQPDNMRALEGHLRSKGVDGWFDYWGYDVNHDWPWWFIQMNYFLRHLTA